MAAAFAYMFLGGSAAFAFSKINSTEDIGWAALLTTCYVMVAGGQVLAILRALKALASLAYIQGESVGYDEGWREGYNTSAVVQRSR